MSPSDLCLTFEKHISINNIKIKRIRKSVSWYTCVSIAKTDTKQLGMNVSKNIDARLKQQKMRRNKALERPTKSQEKLLSITKLNINRVSSKIEEL